MADREQQLSVFPAFFKVEDRVVAIFGNGAEAFAKTRLLLNTRADIRVYAEAPEADFARFILDNAITHISASFSRDAIENALYSFNEPVTPNAVEAIVSRLRRKLEEAGLAGQLHTVRGVGYMLRSG